MFTNDISSADSLQQSDELNHHGVMGMKWGKRRSYKSSIGNAARSKGIASDIRTNAAKQTARSNRLDKKYAKAVEKGTYGTRKAKGYQKKSAKLTKKAGKNEALAKRHDAAAANFVKKAAETGVRSYPTPKRDKAKNIIKAINLESAFGMGVGVGSYSTIKAKQNRKNEAAAEANVIQDKKKK